MNLIRQALGEHLEWIRPDVYDDSRYELVSTKGLLGILKFAGGFGSRPTGSTSVGTCAQASWEFVEEPARVIRQIIIREAASRTELGVFQSQRLFLLPARRRYRWQRRPPSEWSFDDESGGLARFSHTYENVGQLSTRMARVDVAPAGMALSDLELLIFLGGLLLILKQRDCDDAARLADRDREEKSDAEAEADAGDGDAHADAGDADLDWD